MLDLDFPFMGSDDPGLVDPRSHAGRDAQRIGGGTRVEFEQATGGILQAPHVKVNSQ